MASRYIKRYSTLLLIREMQSKTTAAWYHHTPVRMSINKKPRNNKFWRGCGEKESLLHCWLECTLVQPLWKTVWRFIRKQKIELPCDPAIPLLSMYSEKTKIASFFYICLCYCDFPFPIDFVSFLFREDPSIFL